MADAAAPLTFTDVQREAAAKQRTYEATTAEPSGRGAETAGTPRPHLLSRAVSVAVDSAGRGFRGECRDPCAGRARRSQQHILSCDML